MTRFANLALSAATALGIAFAPVPAVAGPDAEDIAKALAGIALLGIIAKAASDRDDRRSSAAVTQDRYPRLGLIEERDHRERAREDMLDRFPILNGVRERDRRNRIIEGEFRGRDDWGRDRKQKYKKARLPDRCLRVVETNRYDQLVYGTRCLETRFKYSNRLPQRCERFVRSNRGLVSVYDARCLAQDGWRVASR